jgi:hypothetical protein
MIYTFHEILYQIKENEMGLEVHTELWSESIKKRDHFEDIRVDYRILLR